MRKLLVLGLLIAGSAGYFIYQRTSGSAADRGAADTGTRQAGGVQRPGAGAMARPPMTVETVAATRAPLSEYITVVGNLIGAATVEVVPKVSGRLESIDVRLGDPVKRGQRLARVESSEIEEQVKQARASNEVNAATVRQREADLKFAITNLERSKNLFDRQLLPRQTLDDAEARHQAAVAQLDLARAQYTQAQARLSELQITLADTFIVSPVNGFVGKRYLDPGGFASTNSPVVSVVDIGTVRLVANVVERELRRVNPGLPTTADVDAFPGEQFNGRVARVAPVLDPATRTAEMEVELPNPGYRLRPGMYSRVRLQVANRPNALVVPRNAVVDLENQRGVFFVDGRAAKFVPVQTGIQDDKQIEIVTGISEGDRVVTTGAAALRDGDPVLLAGQRPSGGQGQGRPGGRMGGQQKGPETGSPRGPGEKNGAPQGNVPQPQ
jgi:HlyD family secretion protein